MLDFITIVEHILLHNHDNSNSSKPVDLLQHYPDQVKVGNDLPRQRGLLPVNDSR